jgi:hypothetical protein
MMNKIHLTLTLAGFMNSLAMAETPVTNTTPRLPTAAMDIASPERDRVLAALTKAQYQFTPEVKSAFLDFRKAQAIRELAANTITLPPDFLSWVAGDPIVASTVYGIRHGTPAQALFVLRSLELDIGVEKMRGKYTQLGLAAARLHAASINLAVPSTNSFSLAARPLLEVKIPPCPLVKVDTHPKDRPMDVNDHIINFLEESETVTKDANGKELVTVTPREPILTAGQVVASRKLQKEFNDYMERKGQKIQPLDCGDNLINTYTGVIWRHPYCGRFQYASKLFKTAYIEKGRLVQRNDPLPTPTEWIAYQIRSAEDPARAINLQNPWPILMYMVGHRVALREAEFVWAEKAKGINPMRYIMYIGSIAQAGEDLIILSRLQPYEFPYNSYPGKRLWGGVCGSHTHTACVAGSTLGMSMVACSSPGHSFPGSFGKDKNGVWTFGGGHTGAAFYFGAAGPEGTGSDLNKLRSVCWGINSGLDSFLDAQLAWTLELQLPPSCPASQRMTLLKSAVSLNPYCLGLMRTAQASIAAPQDHVAFYQNMERALLALGPKPGCPNDPYRAEFENTLLAKLDALPVPTEKGALAYVASFVSSRGDALWSKYQAASIGLPAIQEQVTAELKANVAGTRTQTATDLIAQRITAVGNSISDLKEKNVWAENLLQILHGHERFAPDAKKPKELVVDPGFSAAYATYALGIGLSAAQAELELELKAGIDGRRTTDGCELLAKKMIAVGNLLPPPVKKEAAQKTLWCQKLLTLLRGHEIFAPDSTHPEQRVADPCLAAIYCLDNRQKAECDRLVTDYQSAVAQNRGDAIAQALALRLQTLRSSILDKKELSAFDDAIIATLAGHHFFYPDMKQITVRKVNPALRVLQHKASREILISELKTTLANGQSPESSEALSEYLRLLWMPIRWDIPGQAKLAQEICDILRGHELYAPDAKKPGDLRFDKLLHTVYHNWGRTPHNQGGITPRPADQNAGEEWLKKVMAVKRTPEGSAAMKSYLECLAGRLGGPARKAWGAQLLPLVQGQEYTEGTDTAGKKTLSPDPVVSYVYALAGQRLPPSR